MNELSYLHTLPSALIAVDRKFNVCFLNTAAEMLLGVSGAQVNNRPLLLLPAFGDTFCALCERVFATHEEISLFEQTLPVPMHHRIVTMHLTPVMEEGNQGEPLHAAEVLISIEKADGLDRLAASDWKQEATRAAGVMAAMLAHEVKNPLSGIRGAAQLLKDEVMPEHQALTELICMETDRIRDLLAQVEIFSNVAPENIHPVNIHEVLQYVISIAHTGFAPHVAFKEIYDPSLPPVLGHRDLLVQLFLNLLKNSAEALSGRPDAAITLTTAYRSGYRIKAGSSHERVSLPVVVTISDNGSGIPEPIRSRLFEPFVSSKEDGRGLGLAVVAKIATDLGIVVELDKDFDAGAKFLICLPVDRGYVSGDTGDESPLVKAVAQ